MAVIDNLVSYYKLDEASGNALDAHGSNNLTDINTVGTGTGKINNGRDLESGSAQYFTRTNSIISAWPFTLSAWIKLESTGAAKVIFSLDGDTLTHIAEIIVNASNVLQVFCEDAGVGNVNFTCGTTLTSGVWYHVMAVFNTGAFEVWLNGVSDGTSTTARNFPGVTRTRIGTRFYAGSAGDYWDGLIDEVGVWNVAKTGTDATALYNGGNGLAYPFSTSTVSQLCLLGCG